MAQYERIPLYFNKDSKEEMKLCKQIKDRAWKMRKSATAYLKNLADVDINSK